MPLHVIYHPPGIYTAEEKASLVSRITAIYTSPPAELPAFWVNVIFRPTPAEDFFVGGRGPTGNYVRIVVEHIARPLSTDTEHKRGFMKKYWAAIQPFTEGKDMGCEVSIDHTPSELWVIDGVRPPFGGSPEEVELRAEWREKNHVILDAKGGAPAPVVGKSNA